MAGIGATDAYASALSGIQAGQGRVAAAAQQLTQEIDPQAMIEMMLGEAQVEASAQVARSVDESLGQLLDTLA